jgi:hypothetical protein
MEVRMGFKYTKAQIETVVISSKSKAEAIRKLGFKGYEGGHYRTLNKYIALYDLNTSHFLGQGWNLCLKRNPNPTKPLDELLVEKSTASTCTVKRRILREKRLPYRCYNCGIYEWDNKPISLQLDHKNGTPSDNRIVNLRLLCPNCHSQTNTYCRAKTDENGRRTSVKSVVAKERLCPVRQCAKKNCDQMFRPSRSRSKFCSAECYHTSKKGVTNLATRKVKNRPTQEKLRELLATNSYSAVGRIYEVSDNTIRKWLRT